MPHFELWPTASIVSLSLNESSITMKIEIIWNQVQLLRAYLALGPIIAATRRSISRHMCKFEHRLNERSLILIFLIFVVVVGVVPASGRDICIFIYRGATAVRTPSVPNNRQTKLKHNFAIAIVLALAPCQPQHARCSAQHRHRTRCTFRKLSQKRSSIDAINDYGN